MLNQLKHRISVFRCVYVITCLFIRLQAIQAQLPSVCGSLYRYLLKAPLSLAYSVVIAYRVKANRDERYLLTDIIPAVQTTFTRVMHKICSISVAGQKIEPVTCLLTLSVCFLSATAQAEEVQWIATGGGDWQLAANWSNNVVPVAGDDVVINLSIDNEINYNGGDSEINSLTMTGHLNLYAGSISVSAASEISGMLTVQQGATLAANGLNASILVNGIANIGGGNIHALNGAQVSLPGATRYQGGGTLRAKGAGSKLDLSALSTIGIGTPGTTDLNEAFSRAVSIYHKPPSLAEDGLDLGINEAFSRAVSIYHKPAGLAEDGLDLGINEAFSRQVTINNVVTQE